MASLRRDFLRTLVCAGGAATFLPSHLRGLTDGLAFSDLLPLDESSGPVRLNSNENAYGPSEKVVASMRAALQNVKRYPYSQYDLLAEQIAHHHGVRPEQLLLGCGSTEILRMAAAAFLHPGKRLIQANPTFEGMEHYAQAERAEVVSLGLTPYFAHDLDAMSGRLDENTALVYICNPNNPTGTLTPRADLELFIKKLPPNTQILIDEAYHHYAGESALYRSFIDRPIEDERVIVTRTFSQVYGLAGLRLGYAVGSPKVLQLMRAHATEQSVSGVAAVAALAALEDTESLRESVKRNANDRQEFRNSAMVRMLKPIDSHANFVMMDTHHPAEEVIDHFEKNGVLIGPRFPAMDTHIRVSLGIRPEMVRFWQVWDMLHYTQMHM
jgi:histidinol-phosphate aminotransferase